jgi:hypothetical protein
MCVRRIKKVQFKVEIILKKKFQNNSALGKILMRPRHNFLQNPPIETGAGVFFSARRNVFMARNMRYGVLLA